MLAETAEAANGIAKRKQIVHNFNNSHFATAFGGISKLKGSPGNVTMAVWGLGGGRTYDDRMHGRGGPTVGRGG